jgi:hypothetical protein
MTEPLDRARVRLMLAAVGAGVQPSTAALLAEAVAEHLAALRPGMLPDARALLELKVATASVVYGRARRDHCHGRGEPLDLAAAQAGVSRATLRRRLELARAAREHFCSRPRHAA